MGADKRCIPHPNLSVTLCEGYRAAVSSSSIERNHEMKKLVQTSRRVRIGEGKVEKQVTVGKTSSGLGVGLMKRVGF